MMRRSVPGPFTVQDLGAGRMYLATTGDAAVEIYVRTSSPGAARMLAAASIRKLDLEWLSSRVTMILIGDEDRNALEADYLVVHEAVAQLYDGLPMAGFDRNAKRFWRRVFMLMRVPGGRSILRLIARRKR